jgi:hypothetical protein
MRNLRTRTLLAAAGALGAVALVANPAAAFYISGGCSYGPNTLNVTNYSKGSGQEIHWATHSTWNVWKVEVNGVRQASKTEGYVYFANPTASYPVKASWYYPDPDGGTRSCTYWS